VHESKATGRTVRAAACVAIVVACLGGCSDPKRTAEQKVLQEVDAAHRLTAKAVGLMAGAAFKVDGEFAPPLRPRLGAPEVTDIQPAAVPHPQAWEDLETAERRLSGVLQEYGQAAGDDSQALAYAALGQVLIAKGRYQDFSADAARDEAAQAIVQGERGCLTVKAWAGLLDRIERPGSDVEAEAQRMLTSARSDIENLKARIAKAAEEIGAIRNTIRSLQARNEEMIPKVRNLRVDIQLASGQKGMELTDQVLKLDKEINENASGIAKLESDLDLRESGLKELEEAQTEAETRASVASSIIEGGKASSTRRAGEQAAVQKALDHAKAEARRAAERVAQACRAVAKAEDVAADAFDLAAKKLERAARLQDRSGRGAALGEQADAFWTLANLQARRLQLRARCVRLVEHLSAAWAPDQPALKEAGEASTLPAKGSVKPKLLVPDFAKPILEYLYEAEQVRKAAVENYERAAELYSQAADSVAPQVRWLYQGHQAAAYLALHQLTNRHDVLTKAMATLEEALKDKRESPYLAYLVALHKLAKSRQ
jgi:hypothetical protein